MTDFDKLKEAAEEIKLDDLQKQRILEACKGKKRKKINYSAIAAAAAVLVITVVVFSPGFMLKAGAPADSAENEMAVEDNYFADEDIKYYSDSFSAQSANGSTQNGTEYVYTVGEDTCIIFDAKSFRSIYSSIPQPFINLVNHEDFTAWSAAAVSDNGMAIVQFVEHFGISKEDFDNTNRSYAKLIYDFYGKAPLYRAVEKSNELYEIFNTELIYSFDREAIDEYYTAFNRPYENESGNIISGSSPAEIIVPEDYYK